MRIKSLSMIMTTALGLTLGTATLAHGASVSLGEGILEGALRGGLIGAGVGLVIGVVMMLFKKKPQGGNDQQTNHRHDPQDDQQE